MDPWSRSLHQLPKDGAISGVQQDNCGLRLEEHGIPYSLFQLVLPEAALSITVADQELSPVTGTPMLAPLMGSW